MAGGNNGATLRQVHRLYNEGTASGLAEAQLLERFLSRRDEVAFEALVARHGPMVLGVCRRLLRDPHAIEDAFQATFLVLVRKAGSLRSPNLLGPWLYGVAYRVALRAKASAARRSAQETPYTESASDPVEDDFAADIRPVLDEELRRLPERYRVPLVLCYLEGHTHDEAAERLRCPVGTVRSRLSRGRERLRNRLIRRGLAPATGFLGVGLWTQSASAALSPSLLQNTVEAATHYAAGQLATAGIVSASAAALTQGVLTTMFLSKLKVVAVGLLALGVLGGGARLWTTRGIQAAQAPDKPGAATGTDEKAPAEDDLLQLQGLWMITEGEPKNLLGAVNSWRFQGSKLIFGWEGVGRRGIPAFIPHNVVLDSRTTPKRLTTSQSGSRPADQVLDSNGIYQLQGDSLRVLLSMQGKPAPTDFSKKLGYLYLVLERQTEPVGKPSTTVVKPKRAKTGDLILVEVLEALPGRPITGERQVRSDGTISLGFYGDLKVEGMTRKEIKVAVINHLRDYLIDQNLGLTRPDLKTGKMVPADPADSDKVFVDDEVSRVESPPRDDRRLTDIEKRLDAIAQQVGAKVNQPRPEVNSSTPPEETDPSKRLIKPGDYLMIHVRTANLDVPGLDVRQVDPEGMVNALGGSQIRLAGFTLNQAKVKLINHLRSGSWSADVLGLRKVGPDGKLVDVDPADSDRVRVRFIKGTPDLEQEFRLADLARRVSALSRQVADSSPSPNHTGTPPPSDAPKTSTTPNAERPIFQGLENRLHRARRLLAIRKRLNQQGSVSVVEVEKAEAELDAVVEEIETQDESLSDELELLAIEREKKAAELRVAEAQLHPTKVRLTELANPPGFQHGEVRENLVFTPPVRSMPEFKNLIAEKQLEEAQRDVKAAELRGVDIRIRQANRRYDQIERLKKQADVPTANSAAPKQ